MSTNQDKIMEEISKENVEIKFKIDDFRKSHLEKLEKLKKVLGIEISIDSLLKSKGN